jgi:hypothetical protein
LVQEALVETSQPLEELMFLEQKFANFLALNSIRMGGSFNST